MINLDYQQLKVILQMEGHKLLALDDRRSYILQRRVFEASFLKAFYPQTRGLYNILENWGKMVNQILQCPSKIAHILLCSKSIKRYLNNLSQNISLTNRYLSRQFVYLPYKFNMNISYVKILGLLLLAFVASSLELSNYHLKVCCPEGQKVRYQRYCAYTRKNGFFEVSKRGIRYKSAKALAKCEAAHGKGNCQAEWNAFYLKCKSGYLSFRDSCFKLGSPC